MSETFPVLRSPLPGYTGTPLSFLLCIMVALYTAISCKMDEPLPPGPEGTLCNVAEANAYLSGQSESNHLLLSVSEGEDRHTLEYEGGVSAAICSAILDSIVLSESAWEATLYYADGTVIGVPYLGNAEALRVSAIEQNPFNRVPLSAYVNFHSPQPGRVLLTVKGRNGIESDLNHLFEQTDTFHRIPVLGLYGGHDNEIILSLTDNAGAVRAQKTLTITTGPLRPDLPDIDVKVAILSEMEPGWTLINTLSTIPKIPIIIDAWGDIRWYMDFSEEPGLETLKYDNGPQRLANGNLIFGDVITNNLYEMSMIGEGVSSVPLGEHFFHHDIAEMPNGNLLITTTREGSLHLNGATCIEDFVLEIDRQTGQKVREWDLKQSLDEFRTTLGDYTSENLSDWFHGNSVTFDPTDETIVVSGRHQGVVKLTMDNEPVWIIANHKGWGTSRQGENMNDYLLTPLDGGQNVITDTSVLNGFANRPGFEWCWNQHAALVMPNGNILMFDNGDDRNYTDGPLYSRAVEYAIDVSAMTIRQEWQYGKERGIQTYSRVVSDVDYLPQKDHVLFSPGFQVVNEGGTGGKVIEIDRMTKSVVFEVEVNVLNGVALHQAERMPIYVAE